MAKLLKRRICRVIAATLQTCRSKDPSDFPDNPVPSFPNTRLQEFKWQKEEKWHAAAEIYGPRQKICYSVEEDMSFGPPAPPPSGTDQKIKRVKPKKKKKVKNNVLLHVSTSSVDSGWFSSEDGGTAAYEEEETETLVSSSLSFSTDSFNTLNLPLPRRNKKRHLYKRTKRRALCSPPPAAAEVEISARLSAFKKLIPCSVDGKVKGSFAIMKRSEDPYDDFKNSMMDMILEKHMFDRKDLEQLLECFLSLNSRRYHEIIVQAFSEIWEAIFSQSGFISSSQDRRRSFQTGFH